MVVELLQNDSEEQALDSCNVLIRRELLPHPQEDKGIPQEMRLHPLSLSLSSSSFSHGKHAADLCIETYI